MLIDRSNEMTREYVVVFVFVVVVVVVVANLSWNQIIITQKFVRTYHWLQFMLSSRFIHQHHAWITWASRIFNWNPPKCLSDRYLASCPLFVVLYLTSPLLCHDLYHSHPCDGVYDNHMWLYTHKATHRLHAHIGRMINYVISKTLLSLIVLR